MGIIERLESRNADLRDWVDALNEKIDNMDDQESAEYFELKDKVYNIESQIRSNETFIVAYKKDEEQHKAQMEHAKAKLDKEMEPMIKRLRGFSLSSKDPHYKQKVAIKTGVLKRFDEDNYADIKEKMNDYQAGMSLMMKQ